MLPSDWSNHMARHFSNLNPAGMASGSVVTVAVPFNEPESCCPALVSV